MNTYARLSTLPLTIERHDLVGLEQQTSSGWTRASTEIVLHGRGQAGRGEDITYQVPDQRAFQRSGPALDLAGSFTLEEFSQRLDRLQLFTAPPADDKAPLHRRWALESAALDLALRQAETSLARALEREPRPLRYAVSLGLGTPPTLAPLRALWSAYPGLELKLDADLGWSAALIQELAATGKVCVVDLKGQYHGPFAGLAPDAALYERIATGLPDAILEDPAWTPETRQALAEHLPRVAYDAPICSLADLIKVNPEAQVVNIKPSRFGLLSELFRTYDYCEARGIAMYAGGQFELGCGRGQAQLLASLFHPTAANDIAPSGFNERSLPANLPTSPLPPSSGPGFR